jgi:hypothetical protein
LDSHEITTDSRMRVTEFFFRTNPFFFDKKS